jgi:hypothetical protein
MNCKPGDLAIVARSESINAGKLVVVERAANESEPLVAMCATKGFRWWCRSLGSPLVDTWGGRHVTAPMLDVQLYPLRDNDGTDETLRMYELETQ